MRQSYKITYDAKDKQGFLSAKTIKVSTLTEATALARELTQKGLAKGKPVLEKV